MFLRTLGLAILSLTLTACNISGSGQKGPYKSGSNVSTSRLDSQATPIVSSTINVTTIGSQGRYSIDQIPWSDWTEITVSGQYFDEYNNTDSSQALSLNAITRKDRRFDTANVHLFSHIAAARIKQRVADGQNRINAWRDTQTEMKQRFGLNRVSRNIHRGVEQLSLTRGSGRYRKDNANLLLFTGSFLATGGEATTLQALSDDFADDGIFNGAATSVFNAIAVKASEEGLLELLSQNLSSNGARNPPNDGDMPQLPIWVIEDGGETDVTPPVIEILGDNPVDITVGSEYTDAGATATDNIDGIIAATAIDGSDVIDTSTPDTFNVTYRATDAAGNQNTAIRTVNVVAAPNQAPIANPQSVTVDEDTTNNAITLTGTDTDGDTLSYTTTLPTNGSLSGTAPNLSYTPNTNFFGSDNFTFTVNDGTDTSASATVSITVNDVAEPNNAPIANAQSVTVDEDTSNNAITLTGTDADGDTLSYTTTSPTNGSLSGTAPNVTYTPNPNFFGSDNFTFTVNDGTENSTPATVSITVNDVAEPNNAPVAQAQTITIDENSINNAITLVGTDADGDTLSYTTTPPLNGSLGGTAPNITYTPNTNFTGSDSFTFSVFDGTDTSASASVGITVEATVATSPMEISGFVMLANGNPVEGAIVTVYKNSVLQLQSTTSNEVGSYALTLETNTDYILVIEQGGVATQIKPLKAITTAAITLDIIMVANGSTEEFDPSSNFNGSGPLGSSVVINANSFEDTFAGDTIELTITPLNTSTQDGLDSLPGSSNGQFEGQASPSELFLLGTAEFTFINTNTGDEVSLLPSETANITIPLSNLTKPDGTPLVVGDTIPLLYLDENTGLWIQEGLASVIADANSPTGLAGTGTVTHFSWWSMGFSPSLGPGSIQAFANISVNTFFPTVYAQIKARTTADVAYRTDVTTLNNGESETVVFPGWSNTETCFWAVMIFPTGTQSTTPEQCITPITGATYNVDFELPFTGTLLDSVSNIMWQDDTAVTSFRGTWDEAVSYCSSLTLAGFTDWELPDQLRYEESVATKIIQQAQFRLNGTDKFYWTSTEFPFGGSGAIFIDETGSLSGTPYATASFPKTTNTVGVRCRRFTF